MKTANGNCDILTFSHPHSICMLKKQKYVYQFMTHEKIVIKQWI